MNMAGRSKRSIALISLLMVLLGLSIMFLPTCGSDDGGSQHVVQAGVWFQENGHYALALVQDPAGNFVSDAMLTINDRPMEVGFFQEVSADGGESQNAFPYYFLDLPDLEGGDSVTFMAKSAGGAILYAPLPAVIPMGLELIEPTAGQAISAGEEVVIRWSGGEGATIFGASYAAIEGEGEFTKYLTANQGNEITVPDGSTKEGSAIFAVSGITGTIEVLSQPLDTIVTGSYFLVTRDAYIQSVISSGSLVVNPSPSSAVTANTTCPCKCMPVGAAIPLCIAEHVAIVGWIIWKIRAGMDGRGCWNSASYCQIYSQICNHAAWSKGCLDRCGYTNKCP